jgi:hypothetical protein
MRVFQFIALRESALVEARAVATAKKAKQTKSVPVSLAIPAFYFKALSDQSKTPGSYDTYDVHLSG